MILITGATGHLGTAVIHHLLTTVPAGQIVALVRDDSKAEKLQKQGVSIRVGDYHNPSSLAEAFKGIEKAVLISSNDFNDRLSQHKRVIDAASDAGVKHLIYTGISLKDVNSSVLKDFMIDHFQTEDYVKGKNLAYTFLRNNLYAEMIPFYIGEKARETGIHFPAGNGKIPFAMRKEMGEAIANVLTQEGHINRTYDIGAEKSYSFYDIAAELSERSGKTITYTDAEPDAFAQALKQSAMPEKMRNIFIAFSTAMRNGDFDVPTCDLKNLLGREPMSLKQYMQLAFLNS
jgi:NAD(P)H dehydrogenase (quinone)